MLVLRLEPFFFFLDDSKIKFHIAKHTGHFQYRKSSNMWFWFTAVDMTHTNVLFVQNFKEKRKGKEMAQGDAKRHKIRRISALVRSHINQSQNKIPREKERKQQNK